MGALKQAVAGALASALALSGVTAQAATRVETSVLSMEYVTGAGSGEIYLLSTYPGSVRISMESIGLDLTNGAPSGAMEAWDDTGVPVLQSASTWGRFAIDVADGYRVTGLSLNASVYGGLERAWHDGQSGIATTYLAMSWSANGASVGGFDYNDHAGMAMLSLSPPAGVLDGGDFVLDFSGQSNAIAQGIAGTLPDGTPFNLASAASIGLYNLSLSVYVSPVPEPATYGMLLGGLGGLGLLAARRRRN